MKKEVMIVVSKSVIQYLYYKFKSTSNSPKLVTRKKKVTEASQTIQYNKNTNIIINLVQFHHTQSRNHACNVYCMHLGYLKMILGKYRSV